MKKVEILLCMNMFEQLIDVDEERAKNLGKLLFVHRQKIVSEQKFAERKKR